MVDEIRSYEQFIEASLEAKAEIRSYEQFVELSLTPKSEIRVHEQFFEISWSETSPASDDGSSFMPKHYYYRK